MSARVAQPKATAMAESELGTSREEVGRGSPALGSKSRSAVKQTTMERSCSTANTAVDAGGSVRRMYRARGQKTCNSCKLRSSCSF